MSASTSASMDALLYRVPDPADEARGDAAPWSATREALVRAAVARDPGIVARARRVRSLVEGARAEGALPSPEANVQVWNLPFARPWSLGDANMYMVELRQRFPAAGSLDARSRAAVAEARGALAELASRERETARRVTEAWADYVAGAMHHGVHHAHLAVVDEMAAAALARIGASRGTLQEHARVEAERARVLRALARFDNDRARAARVLNALAQRPADAPIEVSLDAVAEAVHLPLAELTARALARRATVADARARIAAARAGADAARAEATRPEVMVGLSGWFDPDPNRHDGVGATVGMTLPWLWGPGSARAASMALRASAEEAALREAESSVRLDVASAWARAEGIERELAVVRGDARTAAQRAQEAARTGYVTGSAELLAWIDASRMILDLSMDEADLVADLARAVAELEWAVGEPLPREPARAAEVSP